MAKRFIDAEAVLSIIEHIRAKYQSKYASGQLLKDSLRYVEKKVKALPTADVVEVRHGRWEVCSDEYEICASEFVCSVCKESFCSSELTDEQFFEMMQYCPHCGAKMGRTKVKKELRA